MSISVRLLTIVIPSLSVSRSDEPSYCLWSVARAVARRSRTYCIDDARIFRKNNWFVFTSRQCQGDQLISLSMRYYVMHPKYGAPIARLAFSVPYVLDLWRKLVGASADKDVSNICEASFATIALRFYSKLFYTCAFRLPSVTARSITIEYVHCFLISNCHFLSLPEFSY